MRNFYKFLIIVIGLGFSFFVLAQEDLPQAVKGAKEAVAYITDNPDSFYVDGEGIGFSSSGGSGFFYEDNQTFVTAFHNLFFLLIGLSPKLFILTQDGKSFLVNGIKKYSVLHDLVMLEVEGYEGPYIKRLPDDNMKKKFEKREKVYALGFPYGKRRIRELGFSSVTKNSYELEFYSFTDEGYAGMSGSPILDQEGRLLGVLENSKLYQTLFHRRLYWKILLKERQKGIDSLYEKAVQGPDIGIRKKAQLTLQNVFFLENFLFENIDLIGVEPIQNLEYLFSPQFLYKKRRRKTTFPLFFSMLEKLRRKKITLNTLYNDEIFHYLLPESLQKYQNDRGGETNFRRAMFFSYQGRLLRGVIGFSGFSIKKKILIYIDTIVSSIKEGHFLKISTKQGSIQAELYRLRSNPMTSFGDVDIFKADKKFGEKGMVISQWSYIIYLLKKNAKEKEEFGFIHDPSIRKEAMDKLLVLAEDNNIIAQRLLGYMHYMNYRKGISPSISFKEAEKWFSQAIELGDDPLSKLSLSSLYIFSGHPIYIDRHPILLKESLEQIKDQANTLPAKVLEEISTSALLEEIQLISEYFFNVGRGVNFMGIKLEDVTKRDRVVEKLISKWYSLLFEKVPVSFFNHEEKFAKSDIKRFDQRLNKKRLGFSPSKKRTRNQCKNLFH